MSIVLRKNILVLESYFSFLYEYRHDITEILLKVALNFIIPNSAV